MMCVYIHLLQQTLYMNFRDKIIQLNGSFYIHLIDHILYSTFKVFSIAFLKIITRCIFTYIQYMMAIIMWVNIV